MQNIEEALICLRHGLEEIEAGYGTKHRIARGRIEINRAIRLLTPNPYLRGEKFIKSAGGERERLGLFIEETGEALQIVGKIERFGIENFHPNDPNTSNRELLEKEIGDVLYAVELLIEAGDVSERAVLIRKKEKLRTRPYFPYNKPRVERSTDGSEREGGSGSGRVSTNESGARDRGTGEAR